MFFTLLLAASAGLTLPQGAILTVEPMTWITADDYPEDAKRAGVEGVTMFELSIDENGRVTKCENWSSSGSKQLDMATCAIIRRRAVFEPKIDEFGKRVPQLRLGYYDWKLPPK